MCIALNITATVLLLIGGNLGITPQPQTAPPSVSPTQRPTTVGASRGVPVEFTTHRSTVAYIGDASGMHMLAPDEAVQRQAVACSISDGEYITGPGGIKLTPVCRNSRYLFATATNAHLFRTADGQNWQDLGVTLTSHLFALANDVLIRNDSPDGVIGFYRSEDDGATWQNCLWEGTGEHFTFLTPWAELIHWGHHQAANGTIVLVEYKLPWGGRYIYRSADLGHTWRMVFDNQGIPKHYHAVIKHEALNRWITVTGDSVDNRFVYASDDDGQTWYQYCTAGQRLFQPTQLLDYGDPTRLLFGSDTEWQLGTIDVSDGPQARNLRQILTNWDPRSSRSYCFELFRQDGVYYACQMDNHGPGERNSVISVSTDLQNWGVYHRFIAQEDGGYAYGGQIGGKLHIDVHPSEACFRVSPAQTAIHPAAVVMPGTLNLLPDAISTGSSLAGWYNGSQLISGSRGTFEVVPNGGQMGDACLHFARNDGGYMWLQSPYVAVVPGRTYRARFWIRGTAGTCVAPWYVSSGPNPPNFAITTPDWHEVVLVNFTARPDMTSLSFLVQAYALGTNECEAFIDSFQVEEGPSTSWQPGGLLRAATTLSSNVSSDGSWTDVFTIEPDDRSDFLVDLPSLNIRRYTDSAGGTIELCWEPSEGRFVLRSSINGLIHEEIMSTPQQFSLRAHVRFGIRCDGQRLSLALSNGQPIERITSINPVGAAAGTLAIECGVAPDKNILPHAVFNERFYSEYLDDAALDAAMSDIGE